jgi:hypothetical protein
VKWGRRRPFFLHIAKQGSSMAETVAGHIRLVRVIDKFTDTTGVWVA